MAYDKDNTEIGLLEANKIFTHDFENESELIEVFLPSAKRIIEKVYDCRLISIEREKQFACETFLYRVDIYIKTTKGNVLIEAKNPTHSVRETLYGITQLMMYDLGQESRQRKARLVYLTSTFHPMIFKFIMKYELDIDVMFINDKNVAYWHPEF